MIDEKWSDQWELIKATLTLVYWEHMYLLNVARCPYVAYFEINQDVPVAVNRSVRLSAM